MSAATTKLTLSASRSLVVEAKRLAKARNTSVSALFDQFVRNLGHVHKPGDGDIGAVTRKALGIVQGGGTHRSDKELLADALGAKYGIRK